MQRQLDLSEQGWRVPRDSLIEAMWETLIALRWSRRSASASSASPLTSTKHAQLSLGKPSLERVRRIRAYRQA
jgi:hypothetical protein